MAHMNKIGLSCTNFLGLCKTALVVTVSGCFDIRLCPRRCPDACAVRAASKLQTSAAQLKFDSRRSGYGYYYYYADYGYYTEDEFALKEQV